MTLIGRRSLIGVLIVAGLATALLGLLAIRDHGDYRAFRGQMPQAPAGTAVDVAWLSTRDALGITTYGSSGCPVAPDKVRRADDGSVEVAMSRRGRHYVHFRPVTDDHARATRPTSNRGSADG